MSSKPKVQPANIGVAMIARNAEGTLDKCLASFRPFVRQLVVCVDVQTTDKTAAIAKRHGAEVHPIHVSKPHSCEMHGDILAQHFAEARNEAFSYLKPENDFMMWIDADDVLENAQLLPAICANMPEEVIGAWAPYLYSTVQKDDGTRQVNTLFHRERILRTHWKGQPVTWEWQHRVHEVVVPKGVDHPQWLRNDDIRWVHQHQAHKSEQSAPRNLTLLEIELEEEPDNPRTVFYMGNQYFAMGDWAMAAEWYEQYCQRFPVGSKGNPYELWQSYTYLSLAAERLGDMDVVKSAAFGAIDAMPQHPEPYWRLAAYYAQMQEPEKAIYWTRKADECVEAPFFAFKNPMDGSFNKHLPMADAFLQMGQTAEAVECWRKAVATFPDERVMEQLRHGEAQLAAESIANQYMSMVHVMPDDDTRLKVYEGLPEPVKSFGRARNVPITILRRRRSGGTQPRIVFWCPASWEPWAPPSLNGSGIGGSETAVVEIARRFARAGWLVDVYSHPDYMEGEYEGVGYWDVNRYKPEPVDVFVSWRVPSAHDVCPEAKQRVLWCHDLNYGPDPDGHFQKWDKVMGVSAWHSQRLRRYYDLDTWLWRYITPLAPDPRTPLTAVHVPNGIDLSRFNAAPQHVESERWANVTGMPSPEVTDLRPIKKVNFQCVYASSPDRGLVRLLSLWPTIRKTEPEATLHIGYGWETMDKMIRAGRSDLAAFKDHVMATIDKTEGVVWRGRLPQDELAKLYAESWLWLYPTDFLEVSCCVGDTLIDMPRDYRKYPNGVPIKELVGGSGFMVYAYDQTAERITLGRVKWVAKTRLNAPVWKLTLDDGNVLRATPDHKIMMRDGTYRELQELKPGDSLMPLYKNMMVTVNRNGGRHELEHRMVAEAMLGRKLLPNEHVHHKDGIEFNNDPENLEVLLDSDHHRHHGKNKIVSESSRKRMRAAQRAAFDALSPEQRVERTKHFGSKAAKEFWASMSPDERQAFIERRETARKSSERGAATASLEQKAEWGRLGAIARWNHKVVSVEPDGVEDVYDMEVEQHHNFVASGIVIHNCISAMEAMAGGAVPVTTRCGALPETIGDAGLLVPGPTFSRGYGETWTNAVKGLLMDQAMREAYQRAGRARAAELTWDAAFQRWLQVLGLEQSGPSYPSQPDDTPTPELEPRLSPSLPEASAVLDLPHAASSLPESVAA